MTFKKSPTKNDTILQKYIVEEKGKRLELIMDCKTRWNSLVDMLDRFYSVRASISKSLINLKSSIQFTEFEWETIDKLRRSLKSPLSWALKYYAAEMQLLLRQKQH